MQNTFPPLTDIHIGSFAGPLRAPNSLLGDASVPLLCSLSVKRIDLTELQRPLLSATGLVGLPLRNMPDSVYISTEAMVDCLASLTRLEKLQLVLEFSPSIPPPD